MRRSHRPGLNSDKLADQGALIHSRSSNRLCLHKEA
jgi:hypothetical protein